MVNIKNVPKEQYKRIAKELYEDMRLADKLEARHLDCDNWEYVYSSMCSSDILYQVRDTMGNLLGVTGTAPINGDSGCCVWFLGTKKLALHKRDFATTGKALVKEYLFRKGELKNFISIENQEALTFIKHVGAILLEPIKMGDGVFIPFVNKEVSICVV